MDTLFLNELILYYLLITGSCLYLLEQSFFRHLTRLTHCLLAVDIKDECWNSLYLLLIGESLILVDVKLKDLEVVGQTGLDVCHDRHHLLAMRAP